MENNKDKLSILLEKNDFSDLLETCKKFGYFNEEIRAFLSDTSVVVGMVKNNILQLIQDMENESLWTRWEQKNLNQEPYQRFFSLYNNLIYTYNHFKETDNLELTKQKIQQVITDHELPIAITDADNDTKPTKEFLLEIITGQSPVIDSTLSRFGIKKEEEKPAKILLANLSIRIISEIFQKKFPYILLATATEKVKLEIACEKESTQQKGGQKTQKRKFSDMLQKRSTKTEKVRPHKIIKSWSFT